MTTPKELALSTMFDPLAAITPDSKLARRVTEEARDCLLNIWEAADADTLDPETGAAMLLTLEQLERRI